MKYITFRGSIKMSEDLAKRLTNREDDIIQSDAAREMSMLVSKMAYDMRAIIFETIEECMLDEKKWVEEEPKPQSSAPSV